MILLGAAFVLAVLPLQEELSCLLPTFPLESESLLIACALVSL